MTAGPAHPTAADGATVDLAIVGAGPAGMAAAIRAAELGLAVVVFDDQPAPGGQIYRNVAHPPPLPRHVLGPDYHAGAALVARFLASGAAYRPSSLVWHMAEGSLSHTGPDGGGTLAARRILLATGAMERPFPVPGWTLPGVMTAGAAQIMLKTSATVADDAVFAGSGPLLNLVVAQYLRAGIRIRALLDTTPSGARRRALSRLGSAWSGRTTLAKGLGLLAEIRRAGVTVHRHVADLAAVGADRLDAVTWRSGTVRHRLDCRTLFLHQGIVPNVNAAMAVGCRHGWDEGQLCWRPALDAAGRSSVAGVMVAGDGGGISGAVAAALSGEIAAIAAASDLGRIDDATRDRLIAPLESRRRRDMAVRPFLETLYRPADAYRIPSQDETLVCRCEEVDRGTLAEIVRRGCPGPNQIKAFSRCGMGPCQGRLCGHTVTELFADLTGRSPDAVGHYRIRMPIKPVTLGDIAGP
ncbi:FAD-dependent oxidoreductase [Prosthecomicrobium hirschii]|uniref:FAD-dependent oxidoreductase n=1 Tax=Prosthecodimorpha hirschii TaxID=665126 RepID=UPI0022205777|nr:FAD-dependent oxidoreductase [Prosthecomicrobium hirschii]MCW1840120.1 FAD-dependent oxidoreductase [Prosthecomicrobium hirschii]